VIWCNFQPKKKKVDASTYCGFCLGTGERNKDGVQEELISCADCGNSGKSVSNKTFLESKDWAFCCLNVNYNEEKQISTSWSWSCTLYDFHLGNCVYIFIASEKMTQKPISGHFPDTSWSLPVTATDCLSPSEKTIWKKFRWDNIVSFL